MPMRFRWKLGTSSLLLRSVHLRRRCGIEGEAFIKS